MAAGIAAVVVVVRVCVSHRDGGGGGGCARGRRGHRGPLRGQGHGVMAGERGACRWALNGRGRRDRKSGRGGLRWRRRQRRWWTRVLLAWAHRPDGVDELRGVRRGSKVDLKTAVRLYAHMHFVSRATIAAAAAAAKETEGIRVVRTVWEVAGPTRGYW